MASAPKSDASRLVSHIRVVHDPRREAAQPIVDTLQRALIESRALEIAYRDADGRETIRTVEPGGLVGTRAGWYLAAWCRMREAPRAFRVDRIVRATLTSEVVPARRVDDMLTDLPFEVEEPALV
jgi:predicted DNA-binding transcriptional regulator YafY